ncbi:MULTISPECIES: hypothetical protein [unclassified Streptomyces]|uniref:hypothetical protein n=1 Tax=unclassified Streptomyces TaxID=2593676 RepID=UPI00225602B3|nr:MULTISPECIES: hypothetical protein [unclassified Streptomyces]WSP57017.1 hypothetical protein OG306_23540 [Streptomyces sp. NBC_01241]WSU22266.1 hypothetical protein OG508_15685 [Streptomyces sp. NBC_01108]MCX4788808.1 hypothetical protein [Streptomyces sp. NBC_01221]MCX4795444.1 hypothetical protein [Streptomyces sp. NBC_01242]WSP63157.1 hypothetical protein OG466_15615 [Streptomyces sp. NBC_01240]
MPDRRRRTAFRKPLPERTSLLLLRERQSSTGPSSPSGSSSSGAPSDDNPFAAPPENRPDQPWQPRHPSNAGNGRGDGGRDNGDGSPEGGSSDDRPVWGSQWSNQQPGRQSGGFGGRPGGPGGPNGQGGPEGKPGGLRWDPTDPAQRRARYALLSGMWAFFFALFDFPEIALLLGVLAVYWSISSLRAKPKGASAPGGATGAPGAGAASSTPAAGPLQGSGSGHVPAAGATGAPAPGYGRQQTTAAVSGLVTALLALSIVATTFTVQLVYRDYYTCVNDALTKSGQLACNDQLPKPLEPFFGVKK